MKNLLICLSVLFSISLNAQNQAPQISNINISLNGDETLTINYDLSDAENDDAMVSLHVSENGGNSFQIDTETATGDLNTMIATGTNKTINWDYSGTLTVSNTYIFKLVADDMQAIDIQEIVNQVNTSNLQTDLAFIEGIRHRTAGTEHLEEVRELINQRYSDAGLITVKQEFPFGSYTGENFIGTLLGTTNDDEVYIIDGHYDGVDDSPAADDNGTAVAGVLEAMRILSNYNFKKTIRFISFDLEEAGLLGSSAYVEDVAVDENIAGVLNFEMIGYYSDEVNSQTLPAGFNLLFPDAYAEVQNDDFRGNFIANVGKANQNEWEQAYADAAATYVPDLRVVTFAAPDNWLTLTPDLGRSDHAPFWVAGKPATFLTGTANFRNPNYHTPNDTYETIDFDFMTNVVKAAVATLAEEAGLQNSSFVEEPLEITIINSTSEIPSCDVIISPNPIVDFFHLNLDNCVQDVTDFKIYNAQGQLLLEKKTVSTQAIYIDIKDWLPGVYFLKTDNGVERFLKQ